MSSTSSVANKQLSTALGIASLVAITLAVSGSYNHLERSGQAMPVEPSPTPRPNLVATPHPSFGTPALAAPTHLPTSAPTPSSSVVADSLAAARKPGLDAAMAGRDDATVASYLNLRTGFGTMATVDSAYERLEKDSAQLASHGSVGEVRSAVAAVQRDAAQIHGALLAGLPGQAIVVSLAAQELWGYEGGSVVVHTPVTTGHADLPTDTGPMHVIAKESPGMMSSPWPVGSPNWYPDTPVQVVLWFTTTGEGLHDAPWQPGGYGPGSENGPYATHGCVHVPLAAVRQLYAWARLGTPVVVIPGGGTSVATQLEQMTTDAQGNARSGVRGA